MKPEFWNCNWIWIRSEFWIWIWSEFWIWIRILNLNLNSEFESKTDFEPETDFGSESWIWIESWICIKILNLNQNPEFASESWIWIRIRNWIGIRNLIHQNLDWNWIELFWANLELAGTPCKMRSVFIMNGFEIPLRVSY